MSELSPGLPRINQFRASFDDAALEAAYLRSRLVPDRRRALQIVIVATIVASLNLVAEIPVGFTTDPMAEITILIRIVYFLIGLVAAVLVSAVTNIGSLNSR